MTLSTASIFNCGPSPPTPPADRAQDQAIFEALDFLNVDFSLSKPEPTSGKVASGLDTPPKSSPLAQDNFPSSREKKVGFRSWTVQHNGPSPKKTTTELRPLPQTRKAKPLKSILKSNVCYTPTPEDERFQSNGYFSPERPVSIPKMLESVVQSLASPDSLLRLDGYQTLNGALKAYTNFPNEEALRERLPQLQSFILRDIKSSSDDTRNTNLTTQALKLSISLLQLASLSSNITNDFRSTLFDTALNVLGSEVLNKAIANHFLYLLASPDFRPRNLTTAKADLLLTRLDGITSRISGNSVTAGRLTIYLRLIEQVPTVMLSKIRSWIEHIFHGCLSSNEDICRRAIDCGLRAGLEFGAHYNAQKAIVEVFATETSDLTTYGNYFVSKISDMISDTSRSSLVPRMWSLIILFFRNHKRPITSWQMLKPLLMVIQQCLNSPDIQTKYQATIAWNRLVYVVSLDEVKLWPMDKLVTMLKVPFTAAFNLQLSSNRAAIEARKTAHFGYTNLLYYALQPSQSLERLDVFWNIYASDLLPKMLRTGDRDGKFANRVLKALFFDGAKAWDPSRANALPEIRVEELPRLNSDWLRTRLPKILNCFEGYFGASLCVSSAGSDVYETPWRQLVSSVAEARFQEVRTSTETREALAHLMNFLRKIWTNAARWVKQLPPKTFIGHFGKMLSVCLQAFGAVVFLEQNIAVDQAEVVQPAPTPSNRSSKHHAPLQSPFNFLIRMLCTPHNILTDQEVIVEVIESMLEVVLQSQNSLVARLALLRQCLSNLRTQVDGIQKSTMHTNVAHVTLAAATASLRLEQENENRQLQYGQVIKYMNAMLVDYLQIQKDGEISAAWSDAFNTLAGQLLALGGESVVQVGLVDALLDIIQHHKEHFSVDLIVQTTAAIIAKASWITSRGQAEKAMKTLSVSSLDLAKKSNQIVKNNRLLKFCDSILRQLYDDIDSCGVHAVGLVEAVDLHIKKCPPALRTAPFETMSGGIGTIIEDQENKFVQDTLLSESMRRQILGLWSTLSLTFQSLQYIPQSLDLLTPVLLSGFSSRHVSVVNDAISTWNATFGQHAEMLYPDALLPVLRELSNNVQIELPNIPVEVVKGASVSLPVFSGGLYPVESSDEMESAFPTSTSGVPRQQMAPVLKQRRTPIRAGSAGRALSSAARTQTPKSKALPLPRLRHDNSQIEFVAIENLPTELIDDGSQGLTEHQKEVRERQEQEAAGLLGQFSSSPTPASTTNNLIVDRVRERLHSDSIGDRLSTPEVAEVVEDTDLPDDALGSSPSAQSAQRAQSRSSRQGSSPPTRMRQPNFTDVDVHDEAGDIPSSPPEQPEDYVYDPENVFYTPADPIFAEPIVIEDTRPMYGLPGDMVNGSGDEKLEGDFGIEVQSGKPSELVQDEDNSDEPSTAVENTTFGDRSTETPAQPDIDISRVEDSFLDSSEDATTLVNQDTDANDDISNTEVQATPRRTRKRRHPDTASPVSASKRQRKPSPIKRMLSSLFGSTRATAKPEEPMEDCIVVATEQEPESTEPENVEVIQPASQPDSTTDSVKRPRGRPPGRKRKSDVVNADTSKIEDAKHNNSTIENSKAAEVDVPAASNTLKRRSSRLSGAPEEEQSVPSSLPPRKTRKRTKEQDKKTAATPENSLSMDAVDQTPVNRVNESYETDLSPESQLQREAAEAAKLEAWLIASPRSILGRLKNILVDVKEMGKKFVLGSQEQMELTGLLFELGSEVHAAGQRTAT
ncbi:hypothetical protein K461DRAFT_279401 [Myriangium duriaei CBS 260.36]|uniref:Telomere-associated protein Rif1 N-terminal domain-containing protein n=1 Tax=Myriangium duriaei CBS 260.36 TaxID=1168546 RepID=A0A9P4MLM4_9PEZI|nr:hypothetical protein K461DRAFT_279401 [Myriangium duriaei CBS 260.36]